MAREDRLLSQNIFSVDVEDWFHILELDGSPDFDEWNQLESRVERNTRVLLELFDEAGVKVTFFFLGWVAERFPQLVREAHGGGHEVASHGYAHRLVYTQTPDQFRDDIARAKASLEDIIGAPVIGYRAPGFSITDGTPWALDVVAQAGYLYDASVFPASRGHGGISQYRMEPHEVVTESGSLMEFPASVASLPIGRLCFFGGGYLRLFPYSVIQRMARGVNREGRPVIYYVHPREIDPDHPRLEMGSVRRFKSYVNLNSTLGKISRLLAEQELVSFRDWLALKAEVASAAASSGDGRARATTPSSPRQALTA